jgi:hypothetical protein
LGKGPEGCVGAVPLPSVRTIETDTREEPGAANHQVGGLFANPGNCDFLVEIGGERLHDQLVEELIVQGSPPLHEIAFDNLAGSLLGLLIDATPQRRQLHDRTLVVGAHQASGRRHAHDCCQHENQAVSCSPSPARTSGPDIRIEIRNRQQSRRVDHI